MALGMREMPGLGLRGRRGPWRLPCPIPGFRAPGLDTEQSSLPIPGAGHTSNFPGEICRPSRAQAGGEAVALAPPLAQPSQLQVHAGHRGLAGS